MLNILSLLLATAWGTSLPSEALPEWGREVPAALETPVVVQRTDQLFIQSRLQALVETPRLRYLMLFDKPLDAKQALFGDQHNFVADEIVTRALLAIAEVELDASERFGVSTRRIAAEFDFLVGLAGADQRLITERFAARDVDSLGHEFTRELIRRIRIKSFPAAFGLDADFLVHLAGHLERVAEAVRVDCLTARTPRARAYLAKRLPREIDTRMRADVSVWVPSPRQKRPELTRVAIDNAAEVCRRLFEL